MQMVLTHVCMLLRSMYVHAKTSLQQSLHAAQKLLKTMCMLLKTMYVHAAQTLHQDGRKSREGY